MSIIKKRVFSTTYLFSQLPTHLIHHYLMQGGDSIVLFLDFILDLQ